MFHACRFWYSIGIGRAPGPVGEREVGQMAKVGYARVSTKGQNEDSQVDELTAYGCDPIFVDHGISGKHATRPELDKALAYLRPGDTFVITRLSRASRRRRRPAARNWAALWLSSWS